MTTILNQQSSLVGGILQQLRDKSLQADPLKFRTNLERLGQITAFEISKTMATETVEIKTALGVATEVITSEKVVLATILRAGLPFHAGMLSWMERAENAFVSAYRVHQGTEFEVKVEYLSSPDLDGKTLIIADTMLATGTSLVLAYEALLGRGIPAKVIVAGVIASEQGIRYIRKHIPQAQIWVAAVDPELTAHSYIVPGLGDAGDLAYGAKE